MLPIPPTFNIKGKLLALAVLCFFASTALTAQSAHSLAFEFQAYPTGLIPGLRFEYGFQARHSLHVRAGYNWIRHGGNGVQDNEWGDGFGGTAGYRYYFRDGWSGWFLGARADAWRSRLHWEDQDANGAVVSDGISKILVMQPTAEAGYLFRLGKGEWFIAPAAAFGVEVNVKTEGAKVGEGTILLLGVSAGRRF